MSVDLFLPVFPCVLICLQGVRQATSVKHPLCLTAGHLLALLSTPRGSGNLNNKSTNQVAMVRHFQTEI